MSAIINFHALQAVPASLLNRDDSNSAKGITFGNVRRDRVSSQSWKRAVRESMRTEAIDGGVWGNRTNKLPRQTISILVDEHHHDPDAADQVVGALFAAMKLSRKDNGDTSASIFAATTAPHDLAAVAHTHFDDLASGSTPAPAVVKEAIAALDNTAALDVAIFGRMLAELPTGRIDGAAGYSHPFGVTPATVEPDFFTAVDDCADPSAGDSASSNLGDTDLTSPILYRHAYLDTEHLAHNLGDNADLAAAATAAFVRHTVTAVPSAKQRSTAAHTLPDIVVATVGATNISAANAYTTPIVDSGASGEAIRRLLDQINHTGRVIDHTVIVLPLTTEAVTIVNECADSGITVVDTLDEFIQATTEA